MSFDGPLDLWPQPRHVERRAGRLHPPAEGWCVVTESRSYAAEAIANRLGAPVCTDPMPGRAAVRLETDVGRAITCGLRADQCPEAYSLEVDRGSVRAIAVAPEGLLRAAATLLQLCRDEPGGVRLPFVSITDYPEFRYRCASDWLINVECNRWSYDWGDGPEATRRRVEAWLERCFAYKINQVWFDGFGWDTARSPGYAELMRHCTAYARRRGIRLTFAGYGGGYGTSYQQSEIYRCGYHGQVFRNCRPYPDGPEYLCCGLPETPHSRRYGTCPSNEPLQAAKLAELGRFVTTVQPGSLYLHDIDSGTYAATEQAWRLRCDECRRRWPNDALAAADGHAGAMANWFRKVREHLSALPAGGDYHPARDLTLIFVSPLYTHRREPGQPEVWRKELDYFGVLSQCVGRLDGIEFAVREQLLDPDGRARIAQLRAVLDAVGHGHGIHVIAFAGGDNYESDDLANVSGALAPLYAGAESVCLSNGGVHEAPVQLMNAEWLWNGAASVWAERPTAPAEAEALFSAVARGTHRPAALFATGGLLHRACRRLWGDAGDDLYHAYLSGEPERGPVARVWWTVTREVRRLRDDLAGPVASWVALAEHWRGRVDATREALAHVRRASAAHLDPEIQWFERCLEVGLRFAQALVPCFSLRDFDSGATRAELAGELDRLQRYISEDFTFEFTDVLGGDPGCWHETAAQLREEMRLAEHR